jgi:hypothetical protein
MESRRRRLATTAAVFALCGFATVRGWEIVRFDAMRPDPVDRSASPESLRLWADVPGVGGEALEASLTPMKDGHDIEGARRRAADLTALLSVRPLSADGWLALAAMRQATGRPNDQVLAALLMSWVTGPNEGPIMMRRGLFGVMQWEGLPPGARKRAVDDIAGATLADAVQDSDFALARQVLTAKPIAIRQEIAGLAEVDGVPAARIARLGL